MKVFVLNNDGKPLMPTTPVIARLLLKQDKAKVVNRFPFTIKLTYQSSNYVQDVSLGIDSGYLNIGFSAITNKEELISGEVKLDANMSNRLTDRAMYRRNKRNKLRYRKPRFLNRRRKEGWLPPSIQRRFNTHISLINKIKKLLPISKLTVEVGNFDIQKLNNPEISGVEYQQGNMYEDRDLRSFLMDRAKGKCQLCGKEFIKGNPAHIHHIIPRSKGGTDKPNNLSILHKKCHEKLHKQGLYNKLNKNKQYKESTFMSIIKNKFKEVLNCFITYGYITFIKRNELSIPKTHNNDAFVISSGINQERSIVYEMIQKRKNNRCLQLNRNGYKPSIRKQRYSLQPQDLVKIKGEIFSVKGVHSYGSQVKLCSSENKIINKSVKLLDKWIFHQKTLIWKAI